MTNSRHAETYNFDHESMTYSSHDETVDFDHNIFQTCWNLRFWPWHITAMPKLTICTIHITDMLKLTILTRTHYGMLKWSILTMTYSRHAETDHFERDTLQTWCRLQERTTLPCIHMSALTGLKPGLLDQKPELFPTQPSTPKATNYSFSQKACR
jgi:hypothetical protein